MNRMEVDAAATGMGRISCGNSLIVHPNGTVMGRGSDLSEELLF